MIINIIILFILLAIVTLQIYKKINLNSNTLIFLIVAIIIFLILSSQPTKIYEQHDWSKIHPASI